MPRNRQNEDSILRKIADSFHSASWNTAQSVALGIGDDAALFRPKRGHQTILTCDWFLEGIHFFPEKHPPDAVGWKCLARAVSDVAAMGDRQRRGAVPAAASDADRHAAGRDVRGARRHPADRVLSGHRAKP